MSRENVEIAYRAQEAFRRRDLDTFLTHVDPAVEWHPLIVEMEGEVYRGHDGVRRWWTDLLEVFADWHPSIAEARDLDDFVVLACDRPAAEQGAGPESPRTCG